jgi:hypothetical protein
MGNNIKTSQESKVEFTIDNKHLFNYNSNVIGNLITNFKNYAFNSHSY